MFCCKQGRLTQTRSYRKDEHFENVKKGVIQEDTNAWTKEKEGRELNVENQFV